MQLKGSERKSAFEFEAQFLAENWVQKFTFEFQNELLLNIKTDWMAKTLRYLLIHATNWIMYILVCDYNCVLCSVKKISKILSKTRRSDTEKNWNLTHNMTHLFVA